ncbi:MAG: nodulation protein NfeD [Elusimicrobia bacterium]|nr:nodulation protein NfeD [Elusimicrobiota bacterium]
MLKTAFALTALVWGAGSPAARPDRGEPPKVLVASYSGIINPAAAEYLTGAVAQAGRMRARALVIELDTPGGLDLAMREIVKAELASEVPVIVYVSPSGARAASAGVFITMAANIAAMAPGTNIGAAHPVQLGGLPGLGKDKEKGGTDAVMEGKLANDAAAYLRAIAARRGRNLDWASEVVLKSVSVDAAQAVRARVVDLQARDLQALLRDVDGRELADFKGRPLRTKNAELVRFDMTARQRFLSAVSDPNIAMILMTLGVSGLLIELYSPGLILPGIVGAASLILAFYSFQTLSASFAGVLLILLGFLLFVLELKVTSFGLLAVGGAAALLIGVLMLFRDNVGGLSISWSVLLSSLATLAALLAALIVIAARAMRRRPSTGAEGLIGQTAVARTALNPAGKVLLGGELWRARSLSGPVAEGEEVLVKSRDGLTLKVVPRFQ